MFWFQVRQGQWIHLLTHLTPLSSLFVTLVDGKERTDNNSHPWRKTRRKERKKKRKMYLVTGSDKHLFNMLECLDPGINLHLQRAQTQKLWSLTSVSDLSGLVAGTHHCEHSHSPTCPPPPSFLNTKNILDVITQALGRRTGEKSHFPVTLALSSNALHLQPCLPSTGTQKGEQQYFYLNICLPGWRVWARTPIP